MILANATVKKVDRQVYSVLRECASNQDESFTDTEMATRIGIDPYNMVRRAARFASDLEGWVERFERVVTVYERDREGTLSPVPRKQFLWRIHEGHRYTDRSEIMAAFKEEDQ